LEKALACGAVDEVSLDLEETVHQADTAVFCTPVDLLAEQILSVAPSCNPGTLLTDAGSTKSDLVRRLAKTKFPAGVAFVGSHPLAGSEKRGVEHADPDLFIGRVTVVTKTADTEPAAVEKVTTFWQSLGSRVIIMDPDEHDRALAFTSHLPHLVAAALVDVLTPDLIPLTATGFRDTTRVAAGDPSIWTGIFLQNRDAVLAGLERLSENLDRFRQALDSSDRSAIDQLLSHAKKVREGLDQ
jgi:prephenate dehydrogenase